MNVHNSDADEVILIEKDVGVPMRDGARLKADVFRPKDGTLVPALLNLGCPCVCTENLSPDEEFWLSVAIVVPRPPLQSRKYPDQGQHYSTLMLAALMIGHHFAISAF